MSLIINIHQICRSPFSREQLDSKNSLDYRSSRPADPRPPISSKSADIHLLHHNVRPRQTASTTGKHRTASRYRRLRVAVPPPLRYPPIHAITSRAYNLPNIDYQQQRRVAYADYAAMGYDLHRAGRAVAPDSTNLRRRDYPPTWDAPDPGDPTATMTTISARSA